MKILKLLLVFVMSPSKLTANLGKQMVLGYKVGLMKGAIMNIERKRSKYTLINRIIISDYLPFGPDRLQEIKKWYD